jgi:hypothetical protein
VAQSIQMLNSSQNYSTFFLVNHIPLSGMIDRHPESLDDVMEKVTASSDLTETNAFASIHLVNLSTASSTYMKPLGAF